MSAPARPLAVVLLSGGMDSAVSAAVARQDYELALLHATYGQRTAIRERRSFSALADHFGVPEERRLVLELAFLERLGGSALTDRRLAVPLAEIGSRSAPPLSPAPSRVPVTYVPFRNANLLSCAIAWVEILGAEAVVIGAVEEDSSGYPDCRESFICAFEQAARLGSRTGDRLRVVAPLVHRSKAEIVQLGLQLGVPFELTWSCYQSDDTACGRCESCQLRVRGFRDAGAVDPLPYAG
jgi:7-cyano-7-deazaguanine synthase